MNLRIKQISSLIKVRSFTDLDAPKLHKKTLFKGQSFSYQTAISSSEPVDFEITVDSPLKEYVKLYVVRNIAMDYPVSFESTDTDFLTTEPGLMPDLLVPIEDCDNRISMSAGVSSVWAEIKLPENIETGKYVIKLSFKGGSFYDFEETCNAEQKLELEVINAVIPKQQTKFTQWFHTDCIAEVHNTEVYSEKHWELIDKYIKMASELGINMLLTPVITPALDTAIGGRRKNVQLVDIEKIGDKYAFDFTRLKRWISICKKNGIEYFEICHLFSQWGLKYSPSVVVKENGVEDYMFGWHVEARDKSYREFLLQFIPALVDELKTEGVFESCYFHLSDEPVKEHLEAYRDAYNLVKPLIGEQKIIDALSNVEFYENGLVEVPATATDHITPFLEKKIKHQFAYYCCCQDNKVGNRFLSMPSYRNRILGLQMYKYDVEGFLQWGYNFYKSRLSKYEINPYITTSADKSFPSGDPFSVYPGIDKPLPSLRAVIFREALQDIEICRLLEQYIGKDEVLKLIEDEANCEITFAEYPRNDEFIPKVIDKIVDKIKEFI